MRTERKGGRGWWGKKERNEHEKSMHRNIIRATSKENKTMKLEIMNAIDSTVYFV